MKKNNRLLRSHHLAFLIEIIPLSEIHKNCKLFIQIVIHQWVLDTNGTM